MSQYLELPPHIQLPPVHRLRSGEVLHIEHQGTVLYVEGRPARIRRRFVRCKKPLCTQCPHGPYLYLLWQDDTRDPPLYRETYIGREEDLVTRRKSNV